MNNSQRNQSDPVNKITLPASRSFVVQIEAHAELTDESLSGRVEHMTSGKICHFHSLAELTNFIRLCLERDQK